jgi:hypothetical protein
MKELETVQNSDVMHTLSERTVVEIIDKLTEKKRIDVISSQ